MYIKRPDHLRPLHNRHVALHLMLVAGLVGLGGCENDERDPASSPTPANVTPSPSPDAPPSLTPVTETPSPSPSPTEPPTEACDPLPQAEEGECNVITGSASSGMLLMGDLLLPSGVLENGQVAVDAYGSITCVGCDCAESHATLTQVLCQGSSISPGLINAHDHITYAHNDPYVGTEERYEHRHDWRKGNRNSTQIYYDSGASSSQIQWGELRFVLGGATSTVGSGEAEGLLRHLDKDGQDGLNQTPVHFETFPLDDGSGTQRSSGCDYGNIDTAESISNDAAYFPHVSEGIDTVSRNEFLCLSSFDDGGQDLTTDNSAFIHAIGLLSVDYALMQYDGTEIIWSPRSNVSLYGDTVAIPVAMSLGVPISLGTDWIVSGSMNVLRELKCADDLNQQYYNSYISDEELWKMVTLNPARAASMDDIIGVLSENRVADISIFSGSTVNAYRAVIEAEPRDVRLVLKAGKPLYGDAQLLSDLDRSANCDTIDMCGESKSVCLQGEVGMSYSELKSASGNLYPAFFCGEPDDEPTCTPFRTESVDGSSLYDGDVASNQDTDRDGISDDSDNCSSVFNPIRPVDLGVQPDYDEDGFGDACDVCPLDADTNNCRPYDPADEDHDGTVNEQDNCPRTRNLDQADQDLDGKGDACDSCAEYNPGDESCTTTIYAIKQGLFPVGEVISLSQVIVTAVGSEGYIVQVHPESPAYLGPDYSAIYVYDPTPELQVEEWLNISSATVNVYYNQIQLSYAEFATLDFDDTPPGLPDAVVVENVADIANGGDRAEALESVRIRIEDIVVSDIAPAACERDSSTVTNEFIVNEIQRVDDFFYLIDPFPTQGENFASISGSLFLRHDCWKLCPISEDDFIAGSPQLTGFDPTFEYAREGQQAQPTFPSSLTVHLSRATSEAIFIPIDSSVPLLLEVPGGGVTINAGQSSATVPVTAYSGSGTVTLTATQGDIRVEAEVRVLAECEQPSLMGIEPETGRVLKNGTLELTVNLDIPAPAKDDCAAIDLTLDPSDAGIIPDTITVSDNALSATFEYTDLGVASSVSVTASMNGSQVTADISILDKVGYFVINEVDYDQVNSDTMEFVELYNGTAEALDLSNYALVLINGNGNSTYLYQELGDAGTLAAGQYLVLAPALVEVASDALVLEFKASQDNVQNGKGNDGSGSPDGIALIKTDTVELVDALSYEGAMTEVSIAVGSDTLECSLVEGEAFAGVDNNTDAYLSLVRWPDGVDDNNAATDWTLSTLLTPGAANQLPQTATFR